MNIKVYICTGHPLVDENLKSHLNLVHAEIISKEELDKAKDGTLIWSSILAGNNIHEARDYLEKFDELGIQSILVCPSQQWLEHLQGYEHTKLLLAANQEIDVNDIYNILGVKRTDVPVFRVIDRRKRQDYSEKETVYHAFWSAKPGMGVSTLSQTVAIEMAKQGRKVLYIEWDSFYPDVAFRWGLAGERHGLHKFALDETGHTVTGHTSAMSYVLDKQKWLHEYNNKDFRNLVKQLPDTISLFAPTVIDMKKPVSLNAEQVRSVLEQFNGQFDDVIIDVQSELIHFATVPSLQRADEVFVVVDEKSTHLLLTLKAFEVVKNVLSEKYHYIVNKARDQEVLSEIETAFGKAALLTLPYVESMGKASYELPFVTDKKYLHNVKALVRFMQGETEAVVKDRKKVKLGKSKRPEKEKPNQLLEFLKLKGQEV